MKPSIAVILAMLLVAPGCSIQLGNALPQHGWQTAQQLEVANMACTHEATMAWEGHFGRQFAAFWLGFTIVGIPPALMWERSVKRETWQSCMRARGYRVVPPGEDTVLPATGAAVPPGDPSSGVVTGNAAMQQPR